MSTIKRSIVGDAINFRGMVYGPVNEMGVVALFATVCEEMGFIIEEIRAEFPDCIALRGGKSKKGGSASRSSLSTAAATSSGIGTTAPFAI
jgi:hypothetical protein